MAHVESFEEQIDRIFANCRVNVDYLDVTSRPALLADFRALVDDHARDLIDEDQALRQSVWDDGFEAGYDEADERRWREVEDLEAAADDLRTDLRICEEERADLEIMLDNLNDRC